MRRGIMVVAGLAFGASAAFGQQTSKRALKPEDFARIRNVGDPQLSPDGTWIAYTVSSIDLAKDKSDVNVWMVSWDGATNLQVTSSPDAESAPRWSPDGKYLAFTSSRQEGKGSQIWLLDRRGGEAQRLTEIKGGIASYAWSPDAKKMVLTVSDADADSASEAKPKPIVIDRYQFKSDGSGYLQHKRSHIYLFDIASKKLDTLTVGDFDDGDPVWSPDGQWIAFSSKREGDDPDRSNNSDIYVIGLANRKITKLTTWAGPDSGPVAFTPDSKLVAYYQGSEAKFSAYNQNTLALVPVNGGAPRLLTTALDRDPSGGRFMADGKSIYIVVNDDLKRYLARVSVADGKVENIAVAARTVNGFTMLPSGRIAVTLSTPDRPAEVFAFDKNDYRRVTHVNDAFIDSINVAKVEGVAFNAKDGVEVHGMFYTPVDYKGEGKYPLLVRIHGGPNGQDAYEWNFEKQLFATNGYAVIAPNYRGSSGRGRAWKEAIFADWGHLEVVDVLAAVDYLVGKGIADPQRLGIGGWSYGCITTDYTIATDTRFKAATCGAGSALQLSMFGSDQYIVQYAQELGEPWKNKDLWIKLSWPYFNADRIKTPTLFLGGQVDFNVPVIGGEQMYQALKSLGVRTQLVVYPNEHHGIRRPSFVKDMYERYLAWYGRELAKPVTP